MDYVQRIFLKDQHLVRHYVYYVEYLSSPIFSQIIKPFLFNNIQKSGKKFEILANCETLFTLILVLV